MQPVAMPVLCAAAATPLPDDDCLDTQQQQQDESAVLHSHPPSHSPAPSSPSRHQQEGQELLIRAEQGALELLDVSLQLVAHHRAGTPLSAADESGYSSDSVASTSSVSSSSAPRSPPLPPPARPPSPPPTMLTRPRPLRAGAGAVPAVRAILNKLSPGKYRRLLRELLRLLQRECRPQGERTARELICEVAPVVFEKAVAEPHFAGLYAALCADVHAQVDALGVDAGETGDGIVKTPKQRLQAALLNLCQTEFEAAGRAGAPPGARGRKMGNIRFIGELFRHGLMPEPIVHVVVQRLLNMSSQSGDPPPEGDVDAVCALLGAVGERMDTPRAQGYVDKYFARLRLLSETHPVPRSRLVALNAAELRAAAWQRRRPPAPPPSRPPRGPAPAKPAAAPPAARAAIDKGAPPAATPAQLFSVLSANAGPGAS